MFLLSAGPEQVLEVVGEKWILLLHDIACSSLYSLFRGCYSWSGICCRVLRWV